MKQELVNLLLKMLKSYGYQTTDGVFCDILCRRDGYELYVMCDTAGDLSLLDRFTQDAQGRHSLYVTMKKIRGGEETIQVYAKETGVMIWDRDELARHVGKYFIDHLDEADLARLIGNCIVDTIDDEKKKFDLTFFLTTETPSKSRSSPPAGAVLPSAAVPASPLQPPADLSPAPSPPPPVSPFPADPERTIAPAAVSPSSAPGPSAAVMPADSADTQKLIIATPSSKINTSPEKAMSIAKSMIGDANTAVLKFVPYWKYSYYVSVDRPFGGERIVISESGEGLVNAVNGTDDDIELGDITTQTAIPDIEYEQKTAKVSKDEVKESVLQKLIREYTRDVRSSTVSSQVLISQNKVFRPSPSDIDIRIQQVYAAVWEIKGRKKSVEINAYNGKPLDNPADDGVEFV